MNHSPALELGPQDFTTLLEPVLHRLRTHLASLPDQPAGDTDGAAALAARLREPQLPEQGSPIEPLLETLFDVALRKSFNTAGPGYLAYIPGGGLLASAVADLIANTINRYTGVWIAAPGLVQLEVNVLRWFCELVGYPSEALGLLTTGGSMANFTAIFTARRLRLGSDFLSGTLYTSNQAHHSIQRAAMLAGFPLENVRTIPTDGACRIDLDALQAQLHRDRQTGYQPFCLIGHAGTTNTGAVDPLDALAQIARNEELWFHVDAAYGGFFLLTERGQERFHGIAEADSVTLDPHKGLFLPYGTGCLLMQRRADLQAAHALDADYLPPMQENDEHIDFCHHSPELSRDYRGLRVWLPLKLHGLAPFRRCLNEKLDLCRYATEALEAIPALNLLHPPGLSLITFRLNPLSDDITRENARNHDLLRRINARQRVMLTSTSVNSRVYLRLCILHFRTHKRHVDMALEDIRLALAAMSLESG